MARWTCCIGKRDRDADVENIFRVDRIEITIVETSFRIYDSTTLDFYSVLTIKQKLILIFYSILLKFQHSHSNIDAKVWVNKNFK